MGPCYLGLPQCEMRFAGYAFERLCFLGHRLYYRQ